MDILRMKFDVYIGSLRVHTATKEDHKRIVALAKKSVYTRDFSNTVMFSTDRAYERGWILIAEMDGELVGFSCVRVKAREPVVMLYFIQVDEEQRGKGIGGDILDVLQMQWGKHHTSMQLNVLKENERAITFYQLLGFVVAGEAMDGAAWRLEKAWRGK